MDTAAVLDVSRNLLWVVITVCGPFLLVTSLVGLGVSLVQAVTQVNEQSLSFIAKLAATGLMFWFFGNWMLSNLVNFVAGAISGFRAS